MLISDLTKEHPKVDVANSIKACLECRLLITLITPIPKSKKKRKRRMEVNKYSGIDCHVIDVLSDEEVANARK